MYFFQNSLQLGSSCTDILMEAKLLILFALAAPITLLAVCLFAFQSPGLRPRIAVKAAEASAAFAVLVAALSGILLVFHGAGTSALIGFLGFGLSVRLDAVSVIMMLVVTFVGWVVVRYAGTYLDGEARQGQFTGWLLATLAAVLLLVIAGNLWMLAAAWVATSLLLHKLLLFYPERLGAQRAARKKYIIARVSDGALLAAMALLGYSYGTRDIGLIMEAAQNGAAPIGITWAAGLLAVAAVLKSAQFPFHGWLTEVMETPTPVSALLHAGVINAGGFLLIRFADVMLLSPGVLAVLVMVGGFTAIFGSAVMLTQPAVKTSLAWSTVAQMGFMILQCGLALFPLALLHIVAHSLYKAHSFLASGGAVTRLPWPSKRRSFLPVATSQRRAV